MFNIRKTKAVKRLDVLNQLPWLFQNMEIRKGTCIFDHMNCNICNSQTSLFFKTTKLFAYSSSKLFSTELQPNTPPKKAEDWWYFTPETGQHISLYSYKSLEFIAKKYNLNLYSNNYNLHLFTDKKFSVNTLKFIALYKYYKDKLFNRHFQNKNSLLQSDYALIQKLNK